MTNFGFVRLFSFPLMAFLVSAFVVSVWGYVVYQDGRDKDARYWKRLSLVAEICVAVGLIGLATFAVSMKTGADHQVLEDRVRMSQATVDERFRLAALQHCDPATTRALAPHNPTVANNELCSIARSFASASASAADWEAVEWSLREFSNKYPGCVPNIFTRHSDCDNTVKSATELANEIRILDSHKDAARNDEAVASMREAPGSWGWLLLAFVIAAIGVSIKCARAAAEYVNARKSG